MAGNERDAYGSLLSLIAYSKGDWGSHVAPSKAVDLEASKREAKVQTGQLFLNLLTSRAVVGPLLEGREADASKIRRTGIYSAWTELGSYKGEFVASVKVEVAQRSNRLPFATLGIAITDRIYNQDEGQEWAVERASQRIDKGIAANFVHEEGTTLDWEVAVSPVQIEQSGAKYPGVLVIKRRPIVPEDFTLDRFPSVEQLLNSLDNKCYGVMDALHKQTITKEQARKLEAEISHQQGLAKKIRDLSKNLKG